MSKSERAKLEILLRHWVEHNRDHSREFDEWAEKAKALGEVEVGEAMLQAAKQMNEAGEFLSQALKKLGEK